MLPKARRVRTQAEFDRIFRTGRSVAGRYVIVKYAPAEGPSRAGFVVGSRVSASAVVRNRVRRRLRETVRSLDLRDGYAIAVITRSPAASAPAAELARELSALGKQAKLIR